MSPDRRDSTRQEEEYLAIRDAAADWIVKQDRGLTMEQRAAFAQWLEADERHAEAWRRASATWEAFASIPSRVAWAALAAAARRRRRRWGAALGLAAAAAIALAWLGAGRPWRGPAEAVAVAKEPARAAPRDQAVTLSDGSTVWLNTGCEFSEQFSAAERRVTVAGGEAHFQVAKGFWRPFVVRAGEVEIRALGTAFNVSFRTAALEVLVTEGAVRVQPVAAPAPAANPAGGSTLADPAPTAEDSALVEAGQRAVIEVGPDRRNPVIAVSRAADSEIAAALTWQNTVFNLGGATLAELVAEFQQRTGQPIRIMDAELAARRIGGRFRTNDVDGFVRVLREHYAIRARRTSDGVITLDTK